MWHTPQAAGPGPDALLSSSPEQLCGCCALEGHSTCCSSGVCGFSSIQLCGSHWFQMLDSRIFACVAMTMCFQNPPGVCIHAGQGMV